jgi:hypothetical protein
MKQRRTNRLAVTAAVAAALFLASGCIVVRDSPAPGCIETVGFPVAGGCFGQTAILDLVVEPDTECLDISVNNCNGGILEAVNGCSEAFALGGVTIAPGDRAGLDVAAGGSGHRLVEVSSNFSEYVPASDERIELAGVLGSQEIRVAFTKTAQLCE